MKMIEYIPLPILMFARSISSDVYQVLKGRIIYGIFWAHLNDTKQKQRNQNVFSTRVTGRRFQNEHQITFIEM